MDVKVTFVVSSLLCGGAERVVTILANHLSVKGYSVHVVTLYDKENDFFTIDPAINRIALNLAKDSNKKLERLYYFIKRIIGIRKSIRQIKPDYILSFVYKMNILTALALIGSTIPLFSFERCNVFIEKNYEKIKPLLKFVYKKSKIVVVQTQQMRQDLRILSKRDLVIIPNPIINDIRKKAYRIEKDFITILSIGNIKFEKGYDLLVQAFISAQKVVENLRLEIWGKEYENDTQKLRGMIQENNMEHIIMLKGQTDNVFEKYVQADIFVLSSRYEGFPNVLLEAMSVGLPCISFDCKYGPSEIIQNEVNGILIEKENISGLSSAIMSLSQDYEKRKLLGENAKKVNEQYSVDTISERIEKLMFTA